jgi:hypothetical protein
MFISGLMTLSLQAFIPESLVGDSADQAKSAQLESNRLSYLQQIGLGSSAASLGATVVKVSLLDRTQSKLFLRGFFFPEGLTVSQERVNY